MKVVAAAFAAAMVSGSACAQDFASRAEAQDYIAKTLPMATAANPAYFTKSSGATTRWLTDEVSFAGDATIVTMREHFVATNQGKSLESRHEGRFSMSAVRIDPYLEVGDVTPEGVAAIGIAFDCRMVGCVTATWGDNAKAADRTDVYVQDVATRDRLIAAFRRLQTP